IPEFAEGLVVLTGDHEGPLLRALGTRKIENVDAVLQRLRNIFDREHLFVEVQRHHVRGEERTVDALVQLAAKHRLPLLATNGVLYAEPRGRHLLDVFTCIRNHTHLDLAGKLLARNNECYLKTGPQMRESFRDLSE